MDYTKRAIELQEDMVSWRRYLHAHAEVGFQLPKAVSYVRSRLQEMGYDPQDVCEGGLSAVAGKSGKTLLLRAEMDALPMREETGLSFACTEEAHAHTCGHDLHSAALLGAAKILKENENRLQGTVKFMFQPAEEILLGAERMIEGGILEKPVVGAALAMHVTPRYETGQIALRRGVAMAACFGFRINITGFSAHGCYPEQSVSPINIATHIYLALQELIARESDPTKVAVLTIGSLHSGNMPNTIPGTAVMEGTLRTFDQPLIEFLIARIRTVVAMTGELYRGKAEVETLWNVPVLYNNPGLHDEVCTAYTAQTGMQPLEDPLIAGSEDFAFVSQRVPTVDLYIGATPADGLDSYFPAHHPACTFDEAVLWRMASFYAAFAEDWLREHA